MENTFNSDISDAIKISNTEGNESDINSEVMFKIPDSVFTQDVYDTPNPTNGAGNLYERFMKVMSVR